MFGFTDYSNLLSTTGAGTSEAILIWATAGALSEPHALAGRLLAVLS